MFESLTLPVPDKPEIPLPVTKNTLPSMQQAMRDEHNMSSQPFTSVEVSTDETTRLLQLKNILELDEDDGLFVQRMEEIRLLLPDIFDQLKGLHQTPPHKGIDPLDHTIYALSLLDTRDLSIEDRHIARIVLLFHDIGKVQDPRDRDHPRAGVPLAERYVQKMGYTQQEVNRILQHIKWHDALGDIARRDGRSIMDPYDVMSYFPSLQDLLLHKHIVMADVHSIPGLAKYVPQIEAVYKLMEKRYKADTERTKLQTNQELPFDRIPSSEYSEYGNFREYEVFDTIDIRESIQKRRDKFDKLSLQEKEKITKMLIQSAIDNDQNMLFVLTMIGRELDREYITNLEREYKLNLDNIRIAQETINMTYILWRLNREVLAVGSNPDSTQIYPIQLQLQELIKSAMFLSAYQIEATHCTSKEYVPTIDESQYLIQSDSGEKPHFEGDGIYTGILGGYQNWREGKMYTFQIPLGDTLPIVTHFNSPRAMANVLGEVLDIHDTGDHIAVSHGLRQWRQCEYANKEVLPWKVAMIERLLQTQAEVITENGETCVIVDTDKEAIVWASLARALRIPRLLPRSEALKLDLPSEESSHSHLEQREGQGNEIDKYAELANTTRIKGIRMKDRVEY